MTLEIKDSKALFWYDGPELVWFKDQDDKEYLAYYCDCNGSDEEGRNIEETFITAEIKNGIDSVEENLGDFYRNSKPFLMRTNKDIDHFIFPEEPIQEDWYPDWKWREDCDLDGVFSVQDTNQGN